MSLPALPVTVSFKPCQRLFEPGLFSLLCRECVYIILRLVPERWRGREMYEEFASLPAIASNLSLLPRCDSSPPSSAAHKHD